MRLERIEEDIFRGESKDLGTPQVYGGQVFAQALEAAQQTVIERGAHSAHGYFLRRGDFEAPIVYQVDRSRDGGSFTARRVVAIQHGKPIFTLSASFQIEEEGMEYQPEVNLPSLPNNSQIASKVATDNKKKRGQLFASDFDVYRIPDNEKPAHSLQWWIKTRDSLPSTASVHRTVLAYISDFGLLVSTLTPHGYSTKQAVSRWENIIMASIDHSIWFHRPFRADEWLLYSCQPISTSNARGCARGSVYDANGNLVATTFQEGLARERK